jgi:hypothetical protein
MIKMAGCSAGGNGGFEAIPVRDLKSFSKNGYLYTIEKSKCYKPFGPQPTKMAALVSHENGYEVIICTLVLSKDNSCYYWTTPSNESFGTLGWSYTDRESAEKKYGEL